MSSYKNIDVKAAKEKLDSGWKPFVLDVRKDEELKISKLEFTDLVEPHETVLNVASQLPKDQDILLICRTGNRSGIAADMLIDEGFDSSKLFNLEGGINKWAELVDTTLKPY